MVHGLQTMQVLNEQASPSNLDRQHGNLVHELAKPGADILAEMNSFQAHLLHMTLGICGEAGEILDTIKKTTIYQKELDLVNLVEELGDLEFYLRGLRDALHISRELVLESNISKLRKRYGEKYSNKAAQERLDKVNEELQEAARMDTIAMIPSTIDPSVADKLVNGKWED